MMFDIVTKILLHLSVSWKSVRYLNLVNARPSHVEHNSLHLYSFLLDFGCSTTDRLFTLQHVSQNLGSMATYIYTCFVDLGNAYERFPYEKLCGLLWGHVADGRLLLAVRSLYFCSEVCDRAGEVKSQPFTVDSGFRQWCVPPLSTVCITTSLHSLYHHLSPQSI